MLFNSTNFVYMRHPCLSLCALVFLVSQRKTIGCIDRAALYGICVPKILD